MCLRSQHILQEFEEETVKLECEVLRLINELRWLYSVLVLRICDYKYWK